MNVCDPECTLKAEPPVKTSPDVGNPAIINASSIMNDSPFESQDAPSDTAAGSAACSPGNLLLVYDVTLNDAIAFYRHTNRGMMRTEEYSSIATACILVFAVCFWLGPDTFGAVASLVGAVVFTAVFSVFFHIFYRSSFERNIRRIVMAGNTEGFLGTHTLELDDVCLRERTSVNETRQALSAVDRIEDTESHAFVFLSSIQAQIIPKHGVVAGNLEQFLERLRERVSKAKEAQ